MGLEINAYQAAIRSLIGREKPDFDSEMLDTLTKEMDSFARKSVMETM